jgi:hypothetical protein
MACIGSKNGETHKLNECFLKFQFLEKNDEKINIKYTVKAITSFGTNLVVGDEAANWLINSKLGSILKPSPLCLLHLIY